MKHYSNEYLKLVNKQVSFVEAQIKRNLSNQVTQQLFYKAVAKTISEAYNKYDEDAYFVKVNDVYTAYSGCVDLSLPVSEYMSLSVWGYADENADKKTYFAACKEVGLGVVFLLNYLEESIIASCKQGKYIDELMNVLDENYDDKAVSARYHAYKKEMGLEDNLLSMMMEQIESGLGKMSLKELFEEYPTSVL